MLTSSPYVPQELQAKKLKLGAENSLEVFEAQEMNEKHVKKLIFKEPLTELPS